MKDFQLEYKTTAQAHNGPSIGWNTCWESTQGKNMQNMQRNTLNKTQPSKDETQPSKDATIETKHEQLNKNTRNIVNEQTVMPTCLFTCLQPKPHRKKIATHVLTHFGHRCGKDPGTSAPKACLALQVPTSKRAPTGWRLAESAEVRTLSSSVPPARARLNTLRSNKNELPDKMHLNMRTSQSTNEIHLTLNPKTECAHYIDLEHKNFFQKNLMRARELALHVFEKTTNRTSNFQNLLWATNTTENNLFFKNMWCELVSSRYIFLKKSFWVLKP